MKDFSKWHKKKTDLEGANPRVYFHEREIWFAYLGKNIGCEQDGKGEFRRPVIVFKKFNHQLFWGIPLTTKNKKGKYYLEVIDSKAKRRTAILSQLKLMDKKRMAHKIGTLKQEDFRILKTKIEKLIKEIPDSSGEG